MVERPSAWTRGSAWGLILISICLCCRAGFWLVGATDCAISSHCDEMIGVCVLLGVLGKVFVGVFSVLLPQAGLMNARNVGKMLVLLRSNLQDSWRQMCFWLLVFIALIPQRPV